MISRVAFFSRFWFHNIAHVLLIIYFYNEGMPILENYNLKESWLFYSW